MVRLVLKDKKGTNWFQQFWFLKKQLKLKLFECIKVFTKIKKGKELLLQANYEDTITNVLLDHSHWVLRDHFVVSLTEINYGIPSIVDRNIYSKLNINVGKVNFFISTKVIS